MLWFAAPRVIMGWMFTGEASLTQGQLRPPVVTPLMALMRLTLAGPHELQGCPQGVRCQVLRIDKSWFPEIGGCSQGQKNSDSLKVLMFGILYMLQSFEASPILGAIHWFILYWEGLLYFLLFCLGGLSIHLVIQRHILPSVSVRIMLIRRVYQLCRTLAA